MITVDNNLEIKYKCKELLVKTYYDPILSSEMISFLYNYISELKNIKLNRFEFNDLNKYIDIDLELYEDFDYGVFINCIYEAFRNLYRNWIFGYDYYRLYSIDAMATELLKESIMNDHIEDICGPMFSAFNIINMTSHLDTNIVKIRIELV